ncbi:substrate-binding and VWA domain-containing protein [Crossiella sp. SN42]|uniref:substrate-binding domain-containing protein n=1 Tax=Crossiella sp. SN42 TaxID=2944808 RepID=UPI00207CA6E3|nr:substrate-binding domain-containing protein [Crossiella sp. SN42]MCO1578968.1 substrate-binding and VWA domain-containing protein [Crossiella sp. SN42]
MSGRHQLSRPSAGLKRAALPLGALLGVVVAAGATVVALRLWDPAGGCAGELPLYVTAAAAVEPVVKAAADEFHQGRPAVNGKCVKVEVRPLNSADVAAEITGPTIPGQKVPALWIPDSALWAQRGKQQVGSSAAPSSVASIEPGQSLASSPLVVVAGPGTGEKLGGAVSWRKVVDGGVATSIGDPAGTTEGLATLMLIRSLLGNADGSPRPELVAALLRVGRNTMPLVRDGFDKLAGEPETAPAFSATEQSVIAHNRRGVGAKATAFYPEEGTIAFDYPLTRVASREEAPGTGEAAESFGRFLRNESTGKRFRDAGFRDSGGRADQAWADAGVSTNPPSLLPLPTPDQAAEVLRTYSAVTLDARMLAVIDVSGSMAAKAGNGQSRIELARDAAGTALGLLPDTTHIGLWAFSTDHAPNRHWSELVSLGALAEPMAGMNRRAALGAAAATLPGKVKGNTALYDTLLAAVRTVKKDFDNKRVNSVVLITDGANDNRSGLDLNGLVQTLTAEADPAQPVPVIGIGLGPDADLNALQQVAKVTGGKAYAAREATDIRSVLMDALIQRRCRPNC